MHPTILQVPSSPRRVLRRLIGWLLFTGLTAVFAFLVGEAAIRILRLQGDSSTRPDPRMGWMHIPGKSGCYISEQARAPFRISELGLVGPERGYAKPSGMKRLLLLGDSFTESMQVPYEQSWAHLLEAHLGPQWEVLNGGCSGYGTDNALLFLRNEGLRYDPDIVLLLFFSGNDVSDNEHGLSRRTGQSLPKPYFTLEGDSLAQHDPPAAPPRGGPARRVKEFLRDHSRFYLFLRDRMYRLRVLSQQREVKSDGVPLAWQVYRREPDAEWRRAWEITEALLQQIHRETAERAVPFIVGVLPTGWRIDQDQRIKFLRKFPLMADTTRWDFAGPDRRLQSILDAAGIPALQLSPYLLEAAAQPGGGALYSDHLTRRGHMVVARALADFIAEGARRPF